jgi:hypothetical protein
VTKGPTSWFLLLGPDTTRPGAFFLPLFSQLWSLHLSSFFFKGEQMKGCCSQQLEVPKLRDKGEKQVPCLEPM